MKAAKIIKPLGGFFPMDRDGYIINPCTLSKIGDKEQEILDYCLQWYLENHPIRPQSIWLRGSLARSLYQQQISDIDLFVVVEDKNIGRWEPVLEVESLETELAQQFGKLQLEFMRSGFEENQGIDSKITMIMATQSICLWSNHTYLTNKKYQPSEMLLNYRWWLEDFKTFRQQKPTDPLSIRSLCKQILRTAQEITVFDSKRYSPDLFYCVTEFTYYHPKWSAITWEILWHFLNPGRDLEAFYQGIEQLGAFLEKKCSRLSAIASSDF